MQYNFQNTALVYHSLGLVCFWQMTDQMFAHIVCFKRIHQSHLLAKLVSKLSLPIVESHINVGQQVSILIDVHATV